MHLIGMRCGIVLRPEMLCDLSSSHACKECGVGVCELHAESCELCDDIFCSRCFSRHLDKPHTKPALPAAVDQPRRRVG